MTRLHKVLAGACAIAGLALCGHQQPARGIGVYPVLPLRHFAVAALLLAAGVSAFGRAGAAFAS